MSAALEKIKKNNGYQRDDFKYYKKFAIRSAKELLYGEEVVNLIKLAKTSDEIADIMAEARRRKD